MQQNMPNYYVYQTTNLINGMKYIGKRTCHCPIEEDDYLGSGSFLKEDIKKYGKENFEKTVLVRCKTEEECFKKEEEAISLFNAVESRNYYNVAPGGPSRPNGFVMTDEEVEKMDDLKYELEHESVHATRIEQKEDMTPLIVLAEIYGDNGNKEGCFTSMMIDENPTYKSNERSRTIGTTREINRYKKMGDNGIVEWLHNRNYMLLSDVDHYQYEKRAKDPRKFNDVVKEIRTKSKDYFDKLRYESITKTKKTNATTTTKYQSHDTNRTTNEFWIEEFAKTSIDYRNFLYLLNKYKDLGLIPVYHAVTGSGSITANKIKDGKLKCSEQDVKTASALLDYETKFANMIESIGGRSDYLYIVIAHCFNNKDIDNDELFRIFKNKFKRMNSPKSIKEAANNIDKIYNFRRNNKVDIKSSILKRR